MVQAGTTSIGPYPTGALKWPEKEKTEGKAGVATSYMPGWKLLRESGTSHSPALIPSGTWLQYKPLSREETETQAS